MYKYCTRYFNLVVVYCTYNSVVAVCTIVYLYRFGRERTGSKWDWMPNALLLYSISLLFIIHPLFGTNVGDMKQKIIWAYIGRSQVESIRVDSFSRINLLSNIYCIMNEWTNEWIESNRIESIYYELLRVSRVIPDTVSSLQSAVYSL